MFFHNKPYSLELPFLLKLKYLVLENLPWHYCNICRIPSSQLICTICLNELEILPKNSCNKCLKPTVINNNNVCSECKNNHYYFDDFYCNLIYAKPIKKLLHLFKYQKKRYLAYFLGYLLYHSIYNALEPKKDYNRHLTTNNYYDVIIPMPLHKSRQKERGFNQVEHLLYYYRFKTRHGYNMPPIDNKIIKRIKNTKAQATANHIERKHNLDDAFILLKSVSKLRILLIDDVVTTGSSMNEVAKILKQNGAEIVDICALTRTL